MKTVLVVDDDASIRFAIRDFLSVHGFRIDEAETCREAEERFCRSPPDIAIIDYRLPDGDALDLLARFKKIDDRVPIAILTGHATIDLAVRAIKEGAEQFLTKPIELPALLVVIQRALANRRSRRKELAAKPRHGQGSVDPFVGNSNAIRRLAAEARKVLPTESPILIQGETGAGKGVLARWIHDNGARADEPFVDVNCAGLSRELLESELFGHEKGAFTGAVGAKPGLFELAHQGSVFLDEIGDLEPGVQAKLLKVIEEHRFRRVGSVTDLHVDVRLISATHQDLDGRVREHAFRSDLYFRISAIPLFVPPLRERADDVSALAHSLLAGIQVELGRSGIELSGEAEQALQAYSWPGNIRELRNVMERAVLLAEHPLLTATDLRFPLAATTDTAPDNSNLTLVELERRHIASVLSEQGGRVAATARKLGIPRSSLYQKIKKYRITATD